MIICLALSGRPVCAYQRNGCLLFLGKKNNTTCIMDKPETLYHRDALIYIAYVMLIWAAPIPADRWHCSLWP